MPRAPGFSSVALACVSRMLCGQRIGVSIRTVAQGSGWDLYVDAAFFCFMQAALWRVFVFRASDPFEYCLPIVVSFSYVAFYVRFIARLCSLRRSFVQGNIAAAALMRLRAITYV